MTDENKDQKKSTLTLGSKLTLSKPHDGQVRQSQGIATKTINKLNIEVKKKRVFNKESDVISKESSKENLDQSSESALLNQLNKLTSNEQNERLRVLQRANEAYEKSKKDEFIATEKAKEEQAAEALKQEVIIEEEIIDKPVPIIEEPVISPKVQVVDNSFKPVKAPEKEIKSFDNDFDDKKNKKIIKPEHKPRSKFEQPRRSAGKININVIDAEEERTRSLASLKRAREKAKRSDSQISKDQEKIIREVIIPEAIIVQELASRMSVRSVDVVKELIKLGVFATANQVVDADTAELIVESFGHKVKRIADSDVEDVLEFKDEEGHLENRPPVVTVMGHVDHGKTSLLDALRSTDIALGEAGGITQHIGAYQVELKNGEKITFIDTPGHEAFTSMRSRGAKVTDIVVLVVAADDGIKAQTIEAINHAKAANVPIIVAVNKIDKPEADPSKVRTELLSHDLVPEEYGGDIICVDVSAKARLNLDKLEEVILLQAEMLNLRSRKDCLASGTVIEARVDKGCGVIATILIQRGTLKPGDIIVAGSTFGKIRVINNDKGKSIKEAFPSMPVEVQGLEFAPEAGDHFAIVETDKQARDIAEYRGRKTKTLRHASVQKVTLEEMFSKVGDGKLKELALIIKADVQGSLEAIIGSLMKIASDEVKIKLLHTAVGAINESDVTLASASKAVILGFNVRATNTVKVQAANTGTDIRYYSIIYDLVNDIKALVTGMLSPVLREEFIGTVEIRQVINITKVGKIAGSYVTKGIIKRGAGVRLLRDNIVIHEGKLKTLKRFKDEVKEVREGFECGIAFEHYDDIKEGDFVEVYEVIEERKVLE